MGTMKYQLSLHLMCERTNNHYLRVPQEKWGLQAKARFSCRKKVKRLFREVDDTGGFAEYGAYGRHGGRFGQVKKNGGFIH